MTALFRLKVFVVVQADRTMARVIFPSTLQLGLGEVSEERFCKSEEAKRRWMTGNLFFSIDADYRVFTD